MANKDTHKTFGVDLDPNNDLTHTPQPDGDVKVTHKGKEIKYMDYIDIMEERATRKGEGKNTEFGGFGKGTLKKAYEK